MAGQPVVFAVVILLFSIVGVLAADTPADADMLSLISSYDRCHAYDAGGVYSAIPFAVIFWSVDQANSRVNFAMNCYSANLPLGYCALGLKTSAQTGTGAALNMPTSDTVMVIRYANDSVVATDFWIGPNRAKCSPGGLAADQGVCLDSDISPPGKNDVTDAGQGQVLLGGRKLTARWSRPIAAGDSYDDAIENALQHILFASRSNSSTSVVWNPLSVSRHDIVNPGVASDQLNFLVAPTCPRNCNGQGNCTKGCCVCNAGFAGLDCSVNLAGNGTIPVLTPTIDESQYDYPLKELGRGIKVTSKLHPNKQSPTMVEVALDVDTNGWVAFGVGKGMIGADVAVGLGQPISVADYYISARVIGCPKGVCVDSSLPGGKNDILAFNGNVYTRPDGSPAMQIKFVRMLNTGDTVGDRVWSAGNNDIVWAKGTSAQLARHGNHRFDRNRATINFSTGKVSPVTDLSAVHGWMMSIAWLVLLPAATFIARFTKDSLGPWWFHLHRAFAMLAVLLSLAAFVIIIIYTKAHHFEVAHARLGLVIIILSILNPIIGVVADLMYKPDRNNTPLIPDVLHWILGWTLLICAVFNVLLGLSRFEFAPVYSWVLYFIAAFTILIVNFSFLIFNVARGKTGLGPRKHD